MSRRPGWINATLEWPKMTKLLEQDKHKLKRKLDLLSGESENRLTELQTDCNLLKKQLDEQQQEARKREKVSPAVMPSSPSLPSLPSGESLPAKCIDRRATSQVHWLSRRLGGLI